MARSHIAGAVHTQYRFPIAPNVEIHKGRLYGLNASGQLVEPDSGDVDSDRLTVLGLERATGNAAATTKALCAVSVIAIISKGALADSDCGKHVYATSGESAATTGSGRPLGVLLEVDATTAAIKLG